MKRVFHLVPTVEWEAHLASGAPQWKPPGYDSEGFVHLSYAGQLQGTLDVHFRRAWAVTLLELDGEALGEDLRLEASRQGALFPHLYRPLRLTDVLRRFDLERGPGGLAAPELGSAPTGDRPQGQSAP